MERLSKERFWPDGGKVALELNHKYDSSALWRDYSGFQKFLNII